ncbi:MAG: S-layer homology domain-containing protein [Firmicutes bacterium]|nr:S-layer homology domain-containing protein [Bacillota bacterium]
MKKTIMLLLMVVVICTFSTIALADEAQYADALNKLGLFLGTENGYDLERPCDRLMGAVLITRFLGLESQAMAEDNPQPFADVTGTYADKYIAFLYKRGLIQGQAAGSYGKWAMTGDQFATLMLRALGYREGADFIWSNALNKMVELKIITTAELAGFNQDSFLRADAVLLCYKVLYAIPKGNDMPLVHKLLWDDMFTVDQLDATKDGTLMIAADMPEIFSNEAVVYSLEDAKKLIMLAIKNNDIQIVVRMPGFSEEERMSVAKDVLSEYTYGQIWLPDWNENVYTKRDVLVMQIMINDSYMMENYYKDPARYQKHYHFTRPDLFKDDEYYVGMSTWVNKINAVLAECITEGMSEKEKVKALHDYLVLHTTYEKTYYEGRETNAAHQPRYIFTEGKGVCEAYAEAFKILMNAVGIECIMVPGEAGGEDHAWNQVRVDGKWYNIDVTWDDPDDGDKIRYDYFCIPDSTFYKTHTVDKGFVPYVCTSPALKQ